MNIKFINFNQLVISYSIFSLFLNYQISNFKYPKCFVCEMEFLVA